MLMNRFVLIRVKKKLIIFHIVFVRQKLFIELSDHLTTHHLIVSNLRASCPGCYRGKKSGECSMCMHAIYHEKEKTLELGLYNPSCFVSSPTSAHDRV